MNNTPYNPGDPIVNSNPLGYGVEDIASSLMGTEPSVSNNIQEPSAQQQPANNLDSRLQSLENELNRGRYESEYDNKYGSQSYIKPVEQSQQTSSMQSHTNNQLPNANQATNETKTTDDFWSDAFSNQGNTANTVEQQPSPAIANNTNSNTVLPSELQQALDRQNSYNKELYAEAKIAGLNPDDVFKALQEFKPNEIVNLVREKLSKNTVPQPQQSVNNGQPLVVNGKWNFNQSQTTRPISLTNSNASGNLTNTRPSALSLVNSFDNVRADI